MIATFRFFLDEESGTSAIEYGLIAGLVSLAIVGMLGTTGNSIQAFFSSVSNSLNAAATP
ncbi:MAG: Flp family type IVb pilin [Kiloniellaceae bacterium]